MLSLFCNIIICWLLYQYGMFYFRVHILRNIFNLEIVKNLYKVIKWAYNMECFVKYLAYT